MAYSDNLNFVSTGYCPGCPDCADAMDVSLEELARLYENGLCDEGGFSWTPCFNCGNNLGGNRYLAHGCDTNGDLDHFRVCYDCFAAINGLEDDV